MITRPGKRSGGTDGDRGSREEGDEASEGDRVQEEEGGGGQGVAMARKDSTG